MTRIVKAGIELEVKAKGVKASGDEVEKLGKKTEKADSIVKRFTERWKGTFQVMHDLQGALGLVAGTFTTVASTVIESIKLAQTQERTERRVAEALAARGGAVRETMADLQEFNGAMQQFIGVGDEALLQMQGTLLAMGVMPGKIKEATQATIGLAQVTGGNLNDAAKAVSKALAGDVGALREYGIRATDATDATDQLLRAFKLAAAQSETLETRTAVLSANWGDLREELGKAFTQSEDLAKGLGVLSKSVLFMTEQLQGAHTGTNALGQGLTYAGKLIDKVPGPVGLAAQAYQLFSGAINTAYDALERPVAPSVDVSSILSAGQNVAQQLAQGFGRTKVEFKPRPTPQGKPLVLGPDATQPVDAYYEHLRQKAEDHEAFMQVIRDHERAGNASVQADTIRGNQEMQDAIAAQLATFAAEQHSATEASAAAMSQIAGAALGATLQSAAGAFDQLAAGTITVGQAYVQVVNSVLDAVQQAAIGIIIAEAMKAAAASLSAHAGIPFVGLAIGTAVAATALSAVMAYAGRVKERPAGFAHGGLVTGGRTGHDSVPAMLTPGEVVIPADVVRAYSANQSAPSIVIQQTIALQSLPTQAANERYMRDNVLRTQRSLRRRGFQV